MANFQKSRLGLVYPLCWRMVQKSWIRLFIGVFDFRCLHLRAILPIYSLCGKMLPCIRCLTQVPPGHLLGKPDSNTCVGSLISYLRDLCCSYSPFPVSQPKTLSAFVHYTCILTNNRHSLLTSKLPRKFETACFSGLCSYLILLGQNSNAKEFFLTTKF